MLIEDIVPCLYNLYNHQ